MKSPTTVERTSERELVVSRTINGPARLVFETWTNDEGGEDAAAITTVTFEERDGTTLLTMHDLHPSKEALDAAIASGSTDGTPETWDQLEALVVSLPR